MKELKQYQQSIKEKETTFKEKKNKELLLTLKEEKHKVLKLNTKVRLLHMQYQEMKKMKDKTLKWFCEREEKNCLTSTKIKLEEKRKIQKQEDVILQK